jgi:hypothetical protein
MNINERYSMTLNNQIFKFLISGKGATDVELAAMFAPQHPVKRGAEIVRSTIFNLRKHHNICQRAVEGQRKQEYYIPFAVPRSAAPKPVVKRVAPYAVSVAITYNNGITKTLHL